MEAGKYAAVERLRNGRRVEIRALRPEHRADLVAAVDRSSERSIYQRFFYRKRSFTAEEVAYFVEVDFVNHVALVALVDEGSRRVIVGGGQYIIVRPGAGELAFAAVDNYQGQGIGAAPLRHLAAIAREAGFSELIADVLPDNISMLKVLESSGLRPSTKREAGVVHVSLKLNDAIVRFSKTRSSAWLPPDVPWSFRPNSALLAILHQLRDTPVTRPRLASTLRDFGPI